MSDPVEDILDALEDFAEVVDDVVGIVLGDEEAYRRRNSHQRHREHV